MMKMCKCEHHRMKHPRGMECLMVGCKCEKYESTNRVGGISKYCQGTPPPDYVPSREPEPIHWNV
jgi:hypothetical protein